MQAALRLALARRVSSPMVEPLFQEALVAAGLASFPENTVEAESFVRGPLLSVLSARVGPAAAQHWLAEMVVAVTRVAPASAPRPKAQEAPAEPGVETTIDPWLGRVLEGRYRLLQKVARGSRGVLYRAERVGDGARVAVKLLGPAMHQAQHTFEGRLCNEIADARALTHPNTLIVYDHGRAAEHLMYVGMEWLSGIDLARMLATRGPLNARQAMYLAHQVCRSLAHAHSHGIVHGDLSPQGIFVARQAGGVSVVKVMDYGRRRAASFNDEGNSQVGLPQGWARYLAPEQITGEDFDARADLYALGSLLYEGLSGLPPFKDSTGIGIWMSQVNDRPAPLRSHEAASQVPEAVEDLVMRCLEKDPAHRFANAEMLVELTSVLSR
jgi:serine/threonine-protein kinase